MLDDWRLFRFRQALQLLKKLLNACENWEIGAVNESNFGAEIAAILGRMKWMLDNGFDAKAVVYFASDALI